MEPWLVKIDMDKAEQHEHKDIKCGKPYLCCIGGSYVAGKFRRVYFGLCFDIGYGKQSIQFDAPGFNESKWTAIWEIVS